MENSSSADSLQAHQEQVDIIDEQLVELLNARRRNVLAIGAIQQANSMSMYSYARENEELQHVQDVNTGPMSDSEITALYVSLQHMTRRVQQGLDPTGVTQHNRPSGQPTRHRIRGGW